MKILVSVLFAAILMAFTLFSAPTAEAQQVCHARTVCPSGALIQCTVYGHVRNGVGGCYYGWRGGVDVWCRGFIMTPSGWMWQEYYFHC